MCERGYCGEPRSALEMEMDLPNVVAQAAGNAQLCSRRSQLLGTSLCLLTNHRNSNVHNMKSVPLWCNGGSRSGLVAGCWLFSGPSRYAARLSVLFCRLCRGTAYVESAHVERPQLQHGCRLRANMSSTASRNAGGKVAAEALAR